MSELLDRVNTIRTRIVLGGLALLAGLIPIALIGIAALSTIASTVATELGLLRRVTVVTGDAMASASDEIRIAEQYLASPDPETRGRFQDAAAQVYQAHRDLSQVSELGEEELVVASHIGTLQAQVEVRYHYAHALADLGRGEEAIAAAAAAREPGEDLLRAVRAISAAQAERSWTSETRLVKAAERRRTIVWLVLVVSVMIGSLIGAALVRSVDRPLARLLRMARRFGEGDLRPVETRHAMPRDLEQLSEAMDHVGSRLREIIRQVIGESDQMAETAGDLSAVSEELAATAGQISTAMIEISTGAQRQVSGLEHSTQSMAALNTATQDNARVARRVHQLGSDIHRLAARHHGDIAAAGGTLEEVQDVVEASALQVEQLQKLSEGIDDFVDLIKRISSQTNLLALNAAIEAARAGDRGLGFAVVAEEVRQLADSSAHAADEVTETIQTVHRQMAQVAKTIGEGRSKVTGLGRVAGGAAHALEEIVTAVAEVETSARRVTEEASQSLRATEEIGLALREVVSAASGHATSAEQVTASAQEQGASTEEMAAQANTMAEAAGRLRSLVEGFTV